MTAVRVYTDASIYEGVGAWGCVIIRQDHEPREHAGKLCGHFGSSQAVEAAAMANALHRAAADRMAVPGDRVEIHCDNLHVVDRIRAEMRGQPWKASDDQAITKAVAYVLSTADRLGLDLAVAWVKGHQRLDSRDPHALYNRRCDQLCGSARKGVKPPAWSHLVEQHARYQARRDKREAKA